MTVLTYERRKWLALCQHAMVRTLRPFEPCPELALQAGGLAGVEPPCDTPGQRCLFNAFRWACQAYAAMCPEERGLLAPGLRVQAAMIGAIVDPTKPPADTVAKPVAAEDTLKARAWWAQDREAG